MMSNQDLQLSDMNVDIKPRKVIVNLEHDFIALDDTDLTGVETKDLKKVPEL